MSEFRFDCTFCDEVVTAAAPATVKTAVKSHLRDRHYDDLRTEFGGADCSNGCGHVFSADDREGTGFDCPSCGRDNFGPFVERYVYWRIEKNSR